MRRTIHDLWSEAPQFVQRGPSFSRRVPLSNASSRSCIRRRSFCPSGTSTPCRMISLICQTEIKFTSSDTDHNVYHRRVTIHLRHCLGRTWCATHSVHSLLHCFRMVRRHVSVQRLILAWKWLAVLPANFAFLHWSLAADYDFRPCFPLHGCQKTRHWLHSSFTRLDFPPLKFHLSSSTFRRWIGWSVLSHTD